MPLFAISVFMKLAILLIAPISVGAWSQKLPPVIADSPPVQWLHVTASSDPSFASRVNAAIGASALGIISPVLPYSIVVTNRGVVPIAGIGIRFSLLTKGKAITRDFFYHSFNQPRPVIPQGESRVFTPLKTANVIAAGAISTEGSGGVGPLTSPNEMQAMRDLAAADEIRVSIDLAVAPDGRTAGPDKMLTVMQLNRQSEGFRDMRNECLTMLKRGDSDESIMYWLSTILNQRVFRDTRTGLTDRYIAMQVRQASAWASYFKNGKRSELESYLSRTTPEKLFPAVTTLRGGLQ